MPFRQPLINNDLLNKNERQLLSRRLCDFKTPSTKWFEEEFVAALAPWKKHRILLRPYFWISTEWFVPDGHTGMGVPFSLFHPEVLRLEKKLLGFVEGERSRQRQKIISHELGHIFDNGYGLRQWPYRRQIFGDPATPYPRSYLPRPFCNSFVRHLGWGYGQSHPDEDFAETFAYWLGQPNWRGKKLSPLVRLKLSGVEFLVRQVAGENPKRESFKKVESIKSTQITLRAHLTQKMRAHKMDQKQELFWKLSRPWFKVCAQQKDSRELFFNQSTASKWLKQKALRLRSGRFLRTLPNYWQEQLVADYIHLTRINGWNIRDRKQFSRHLPAVLDSAADYYFKKGLNRVIL